MNILIKNASNTFNYGTMMMIENVITYLPKHLKENINFYIENTDRINIDRLKLATDNDNIFLDTAFEVKLLTEKIKYIRYIEKKIRKKSVFKKACHFYDAIIILGGDDYAETYYQIPKDNLYIKNLFEELQLYNKYTKLYMLGQTIGPYTEVRLEWAKKGFENIKIYSRDNNTALYMKKNMNIDIAVSHDLAFLDLHLQDVYKSKKQEILQKYDLKENEYICLVGTGIFNSYCSKKEIFVDGFYNLLVQLKEKYPDKKIVYLAHVVTPGVPNDITLYNLINEYHNNYAKENCIAITDAMLPVEARTILGATYFTITCRMHAAVSTFSMNKLAISLSYSPKFEGVISDSLNISELVINAKGDDFWQNKINNIIAKIDFLEKNKAKLTDNVQKNVISSREITLSTIKEIANEIGNNL